MYNSFSKSNTSVFLIASLDVNSKNVFFICDIQFHYNSLSKKENSNKTDEKRLKDIQFILFHIKVEHRNKTRAILWSKREKWRISIDWYKYRPTNSMIILLNTKRKTITIVGWANETTGSFPSQIKSSFWSIIVSINNVLYVSDIDNNPFIVVYLTGTTTISSSSVISISHKASLSRIHHSMLIELVTLSLCGWLFQHICGLYWYSWSVTFSSQFNKEYKECRYWSDRI